MEREQRDGELLIETVRQARKLLQECIDVERKMERELERFRNDRERCVLALSDAENALLAFTGKNVLVP